MGCPSRIVWRCNLKLISLIDPGKGNRFVLRIISALIRYPDWKFLGSSELREDPS